MADLVSKQLGEEDEDYMGDLSKFLPPEPSQSHDTSKSKKFAHPRTSVVGKPANLQPAKKRAKVLNLQFEKERKQVAEDERTIGNLQSAIPQSNIGFKLLKKMGYKPGSALGKEGSGLAEPIGIDIRRSRAGIGREDPVKEKMRREMEEAERKRRNVEELMVEFGSRQKSQWRNRRVSINFDKAKAALDQLENREVVAVVEPEEVESKEEEEEEEITEEDLLELLMKLRDEHHYCLFCGCQYESSEALLTNCPGVDEDEH
ncbi:hypothetical protein V2J09_017595 [Rumex salicifolius]